MALSSYRSQAKSWPLGLFFRLLRSPQFLALVSFGRCLGFLGFRFRSSSDFEISDVALVLASRLDPVIIGGSHPRVRSTQGRIGLV